MKKTILIISGVLAVGVAVALIIITFSDLEKNGLGEYEKITLGFCKNMSEKECFNQLSECVEADSINGFFNKREFNIGLDDYPEAWTFQTNPPLQTNFPNAKIMVTHMPAGGGDYGSFSYIILNNTYCVLTDENLKKVFQPIKSKEDALEYYIFKVEDLGSASLTTYILKEEDYDNLKWQTEGCKDYKKILKNKITKVEKLKNSYLITFIGFDYLIESRFFEQKVDINIDGTIEHLSYKTLLSCGGGAIF